MTHIRSLLFGGICSMAVMSCFVAVDIGYAASAVKNSDNDSAHLVRVADNSSRPAWAAEATMNPEYAQDDTSPASVPAAADEAPPPATGGQATTEFFGGTAAPQAPAWAADATMNPDYQKGEAPAASTETAADETPPPATGGQATTEFFGGAAAPQAPAWAADATMNPDYQKGEAPAASTATATEEAPPPATGGQATTEFFESTAAPQNPAWAAEATMNPNYNSAAAPEAVPAAQPSESATQPAAVQARDVAVETCRETLNAGTGGGRIYFEEDRFDIAPASRGALKKIASIVMDCGNVVIEVDGHTDSTGTPSSNKTLSEQRAKSVVDFLTAAGVDASKLKAVGYGQERPITTNSTPEGRRMNRRIEFFVSGS
jgi:outer membrane protein OmpA-like peptidoglycan-associated protein